jgi:hypothetical protein
LKRVVGAANAVGIYGRAPRGRVDPSISQRASSRGEAVRHPPSADQVKGGYGLCLPFSWNSMDAERSSARRNRVCSGLFSSVGVNRLTGRCRRRLTAHPKALRHRRCTCVAVRKCKGGGRLSPPFVQISGELGQKLYPTRIAPCESHRPPWQLRRRSGSRTCRHGKLAEFCGIREGSYGKTARSYGIAGQLAVVSDISSAVGRLSMHSREYSTGSRGLSRRLPAAAHPKWHSV